MVFIKSRMNREFWRRNYYLSPSRLIGKDYNLTGEFVKVGVIGTEVHHKIHLTPDNVSDPEISMNQDNLMLLCNECHNKEHGRFEGKKEYEFDADENMVKR